MQIVRNFSRVAVRGFCTSVPRPSMNTYVHTTTYTSPITISTRNFSKKAKKDGKKAVSNDSETGEFDIEPYNEKMDNHVNHYKSELAGVQVGRPAPEQLQDIPVEIEGKRVALKNLAQIYVKPPQSLIVSLYEPSDSLEAATRTAISISNNELNPVCEVVNGVNAIVVPFPKPTREVRDALIKQAKSKAEDAKTQIRAARKTWMDAIKKFNPPKDDVKKMEKVCQNATDKHTEEITTLCNNKEKEINNA